VPVVDTEVLFALSPRDPKHQRALKLLKELVNLRVPDTAILEFQTVLRARGRSPSQVRTVLLALREALTRNNVKEEKTMSTSLLALQCDLEERYELSYFDSLVAASTLAIDHQVVSDDEAFDKVPNIKRIPLSK
jgi:predicted nucleic acid-binding protein